MLGQSLYICPLKSMGNWLQCTDITPKYNFLELSFNWPAFLPSKESIASSNHWKFWTISWMEPRLLCNWRVPHKKVGMQNCQQGKQHASSWRVLRLEKKPYFFTCRAEDPMVSRRNSHVFEAIKKDRSSNVSLPLSFCSLHCPPHNSRGWVEGLMKPLRRKCRALLPRCKDRQDFAL